jgi:hypothetical protein
LSFALWMGKAHGWGTVPKVGDGPSYHLNHLCGEYPGVRFYPTNNLEAVKISIKWSPVGPIKCPNMGWIWGKPAWNPKLGTTTFFFPSTRGMGGHRLHGYMTMTSGNGYCLYGYFSWLWLLIIWSLVIWLLTMGIGYG